MRQTAAVTPVLLPKAPNDATDAIDGMYYIAFFPLIVPGPDCICIFPDTTINV